MRIEADISEWQNWQNDKVECGYLVFPVYNPQDKTWMVFKPNSDDFVVVSNEEYESVYKIRSRYSEQN